MNNYGLNYHTFAKDWNGAMPIGNGHIGAMVHGGTYKEILSLNDDTLWSGYKRDCFIPDFRKNLDEVRALMLDGKRFEAQEIIETKMLGRFTQVYLPLGDIEIDFSKGEISDYKRELDFSTGIVNISYKKDDKKYNVSSFCSYPNDVMVYKISSEERFSLSLNMKSQLKSHVEYGENSLSLMGSAPSDIIIGDVYKFNDYGNTISYEEEDKSIKFTGKAKVDTDGLCDFSDGLKITNCTYATLFYSSATSFTQTDIHKYCDETLEKAINTGYIKLKELHQLDFSQLYNSLDVELGNSEGSTTEIFDQVKKGVFNGYAIATLFQYGRYLLISSSREGTQAANLQGIWNNKLIPPWWCNYTLNINLQMNYWAAERSNLSQCTIPLFDFIKRLSESGKVTAKEIYHMNGFVVHHQTDLWAHTTPVGFTDKREKDSASWAMWNMSGPWLCLHLFEHQRFVNDESFLREFTYPIFKECAEFLYDLLIEVKGKFENIPSTSPENLYYDELGRRISVCNTSAMDIGILREFFKAFRDICYIVKDEKNASKAKTILENLKRYQVYDNKLLEWDKNLQQTEAGHRHYSMLFGLYPYGHLLEEHEEIAKNTLEYRMENGSGQTGWSTSLTIALLARLKDKNKVKHYLSRLIQDNFRENLLAGEKYNNYFQIDANFGITAALCEILIQDYDGLVRLLPALPSELSSGKIRGFKLKGGHTISFSWEEGKLLEIILLAGFEKTIVFDLKNVTVTSSKKIIKINDNDFNATIDLLEGKEYIILGDLP